MPQNTLRMSECASFKDLRYYKIIFNKKKFVGALLTAL
jgi:hypothetical protein